MIRYYLRDVRDVWHDMPGAQRFGISVADGVINVVLAIGLVLLLKY